ncbi:scramblase family protein [Penicillium verhagenii]|uniref:scramblase family protein n=1 Tax=Penicillium verhagenii TaxID=1562060 RepID=UPI0025456E9E|nr:scramblase family protein [Penicillium verhagenii]KAJ5947513.1 scramblase family protein [Penicillium verhagenii]
MPEDPNGVLKENHPATQILANSGLVVQRQLEMMNLMIGFEQANKYVIMDAQGNHIGYMAEQEKGMTNTISRQMFRTHRSFVTHVFDRHDNEVLRFHRPFSWINSRIKVYDPLDVTTSAYTSSTAIQNTTPGSLVSANAASNPRISPLSFDQMRIIGESQQEWAPLRRKYNIFTYHQSPNPATDMGAQKFPLSGSDLSKTQQMQIAHGSQSSEGEFNQFAYVDARFLSLDFDLLSAENKLVGSVNRNFGGFAREIFTDTGVYALRMDSAGSSTEALPTENAPTEVTKATGMTLDQRAVVLATAVTIDFDYFSRHSNSSGFGFMPLWFPGMGGEAAGGAAAGGAAAGEAAGTAGAIGEAATGAIGRAGAAGGMAEGMAAGVTGAGTMAGYEAMQRGMSGGQDSQAPTSDHGQEQPGATGDAWPEEKTQEDVWDEDPWDDSGDSGEGGSISDWFDL